MKNWFQTYLAMDYIVSPNVSVLGGGQGFFSGQWRGGEGFLKVNEGGGAKDCLRQKQKSHNKYFLM